MNEIMEVYSYLKRLKARINRYTVLHWNVSILNGRFSTKPYKKMLCDLKLLKTQAEKSSFIFPVTKLYPCYSDAVDTAGVSDTHYFIQDLYVAQRIFQNNPIKHIDIGSRIDGFVAHVASFREIEVFDIRPLDKEIPNVIFRQADIMNIDSSLYEITDSISSLHALEHFGLGRYGDPIRYDGFLEGFRNITLMLRSGGIFYFSVPLGRQRIEFHAHRVFSLKFLLEMILDKYIVLHFSYIDDENIFHRDVSLKSISFDDFNFEFGCAIFELKKK